MLEKVSAGFQDVTNGLLHYRLLSLRNDLKSLRRRLDWFPLLRRAAGLLPLSA